jgi:hypothetical protein
MLPYIQIRQAPWVDLLALGIIFPMWQASDRQYTNGLTRLAGNFVSTNKTMYNEQKGVHLTRREFGLSDTSILAAALP